EGRDQGGRHPGGGKDHVGGAAEQPGRVVGQHHLLADQFQEIAIGLEQWRSAAAPQARLGLAREGEQQRRPRQHQEHLRALQDELGGYVHSDTTSNSVTRATNTTLKYWRMVRNCRRLRTSAAAATPAASGA